LPDCPKKDILLVVGIFRDVVFNMAVVVLSVSSLPRPVFLDPDDLLVKFFSLSTIRGFPVERYHLALSEIF
jgi:hypothetical protein